MYIMDHSDFILSNQKKSNAIERVDPFQANGTFHKARYKSKNDPLYIRVLTRILKAGVVESIPGKSWSQN